MNIFLIGSMGAGKTTIGRHLARQTRLRFVDCDHELVERCGVDIPTIFEFEGEDGFRERESALIDELTREDGLVLATGGGAVLRACNRERLAARGTVVFLDVSLETQYERTRADRNRPILQGGDLREKLLALREARIPLYRSIADCVITAEGRSPAHVARQIRKQLPLESGRPEPPASTPIDDPS